MRTALIYKEEALNSFQRFFPDADLGVMFENPYFLGVAKISKDVYNVLFKVGATKAYLDVRKVNAMYIAIDCVRWPS